MQSWDRSTPFIYRYHKEADANLHTQRQGQSFVQVKRNKQKLPALKDMITPFLTEAIQEEMNEL